MAYVYQGDLHKRKPTGGRKRPYRKKRKHELGREFIPCKLSDHFEVKLIRVRGGNYKVRTIRADFVNVYIPSEGKCKKVKILKVLENKAHHRFAREGVITKGAIVETEIGKVLITSRPGQDGTINGILLS